MYALPFPYTSAVSRTLTSSLKKTLELGRTPVVLVMSSSST